MSPERQWRTEGEIEAIAHRIYSAEYQRDVHRMERLESLMNIIADSAQAQMNSNIVLLGLPSLGVKGAINEIKDQIKSIEEASAEVKCSLQHQEKINDDRHALYGMRFDAIDMGQHRIKRIVTMIRKWLPQDSEGKTSYPKIVSIATAVTAAVHFLLSYLPTWNGIKIFLVKLGIQIGK